MEEILHTALTNALVASVFAILVFGITRVVRAPALARALWLLVLAKLVTPPIFVAPISFPSKPVERLLASSAENHAALLTDAYVQSGSLNTKYPAESVGLSKTWFSGNDTGYGNDRTPLVLSGALSEPWRGASKQATVGESSWPFDWTIAFGSLWAAGSLCLFLTALLRMVRFQSLLKTANKAEEETQELANNLRSALASSDVQKFE